MNLVGVSGVRGSPAFFLAKSMVNVMWVHIIHHKNTSHKIQNKSQLSIESTQMKVTLNRDPRLTG